jgi:hypothetical protein
MNFTKPKRKNDDEDIYYVRHRWFVPFLLLFYLLFCRNVALLGKDPMPIVGLVTIFMILGLMFLFGVWIVLSFHSYIIIQPDGLVWVQLSVHRHIAWDKISRFEEKIVHGDEGSIGYTYGLKLHSEIALQTDNRFLRILVGRKTDFIPLSDFVHIPRKWHLFGGGQINMEKFQQTPFGAKLYEYAPHLFRETSIS